MEERVKRGTLLSTKHIERRGGGERTLYFLVDLAIAVKPLDSLLTKQKEMGGDVDTRARPLGFVGKGETL